MITEAFFTIQNPDGARFYAAWMLVAAVVFSVMFWRDSKKTTPLNKRCRVCGGRTAVTEAGALVHDGDGHLVGRQDPHVAEPVGVDPVDESFTLVDLNQMLEDAQKAGCDHYDCAELTVDDVCGQFVCREHTAAVVECEVCHCPHHEACAMQCPHYAESYARDLAEDHAVEVWKERRHG